MKGEPLWLPLLPPFNEEGTRMRIALVLRRLGLRSDVLHGLGILSIKLSLVLWMVSARRSDKDAKARAERLAIFVGLWPPTFFLLGKVLQDLEASPAEQTLRARGLEGKKLDEALSQHAAATTG
jgi:hypothetical protein